MILNKTTEYAIRILVYMQLKDQEYYSVSSLHNALKLPYKYITKLMTSLAKEGLVKTQMGRSGGYYLAHPANQIYLKDIIQATHDFKRLNECVLGHQECSEENPCSLHSNWAPIKSAIETMINELTLEKLANTNIEKL